MKRTTNNLLTRQVNLTPGVTYSRVYPINEKNLLPAPGRRD
ncbi:hypothetical protein [Prolixibacter bellariivorans]|nr:hypothetical protein [Prolixibacter bellariivorans]